VLIGQPDDDHFVTLHIHPLRRLHMNLWRLLRLLLFE
jgi:hypothetical protein